jgi:RHS repeat-associated protein
MTAATYDGNGVRAAATSATSQAFTWDFSGTAPQLLMDSGHAYIYAYSGTPAEEVNLSTGAVTYLVADALGSVRGTVSSAGALTATTSYDAWGNPETAGGLTAATPFGYAGGYTDPTGLIYLINRYYDPATGQFLSVDPDVAQTLEPYGYASGNPVSNTDPQGLFNKIFYRWKPVSWSAGSSGHYGWQECGYYDYRLGDAPDAYECSVTVQTSNTWTGTLEVSIPVLDGFLNLSGSHAIGHDFSVTPSGYWNHAKADKYVGYAAYAETYAEKIVTQEQYKCEQHHAKPVCNSWSNYFPDGTYRNVDVWIHSYVMTFLHCRHIPPVGQFCPMP